MDYSKEKVIFQSLNVVLEQYKIQSWEEISHPGYCIYLNCNRLVNRLFPQD